MALDDNGKEIIPINLTPEQTASVKLFIEVLKNLGDAYIPQIVEYAQGKESRIHLYSMPRDVEAQSVSQSFFGYETTIENMWQLSRGVATTIQNDKMARNGWADVVLGTEAVLENQPEGQALLAVLDEFHHVCKGLPGKEGTKQEHIQLYSYLLDAIRSGALIIPGVSAEMIEEHLKKAVKERSIESTPVDPSKGLTSEPRPTKE
ncbi:MAG TPA: hypothetical protein DCZ59_10750 [Bacteroidetes bacterium]|nr:hypothetical protein [Bacteroidota bacterium]